jgi:hypothetical protein
MKVSCSNQQCNLYVAGQLSATRQTIHGFMAGTYGNGNDRQGFHAFLPGTNEEYAFAFAVATWYE